MSNHTYRRREIDFDQYTLLSGKTKYTVEFPDVVDRRDIWCEWRSDKPVVVYLVTPGGTLFPYAVGTDGSFDVRVKDCAALEVQTDKTATVAMCISHRDVSRNDKLDFTPVAIAAPPPGELQLSHLLSNEVRKQLAMLGIATPTLEVDEEDNLEDDYDEEDFVGGYQDAEPDEAPAPLPKKVRGNTPDAGAAPKVDARPRADAPPDGSDAGSGEPK